MNACSLSLLFSNSEYTSLFEKLLAWTVEEVEKWVCFVGFEEEAALFSSKQYFHERPCMVVTIALGSLSNSVFERRTSTGSGLFASLGSDLVETLG